MVVNLLADAGLSRKERGRRGVRLRRPDRAPQGGRDGRLKRPDPRRFFVTPKSAMSSRRIASFAGCFWLLLPPWDAGHPDRLEDGSV